VGKPRRGDFGLRWQSAAATPLFDCGPGFQSGMALRFLPPSKKIWLRRAALCSFAANKIREIRG